MTRQTWTLVYRAYYCFNQHNERKHNIEMAYLWGKFDEGDEHDNGSKEVVPGEVVKFFVMQAMKQDPFRTPPQSDKNSDKINELELLTNETLGLEIDDRVVHSIKLIQHVKEMSQLINTTKEQTPLLQDSQIQSLPPAADIPDHPVPPFKHGLNYPLQYMDKDFSDFSKGYGTELPQVTSGTAKQLLSKSAAALLAHAGFDTTTQSVLATVTDAAETYIKKIVSLLRIAVDQGANVSATGFPDAMERVFTEVGIGSVQELHGYYQVQVIRRHEKLLEECRSLNLEYCSLALHVKPDILHLDNIAKLKEPDYGPEIHFPTMGNDDAMAVDELQSSFKPGFQMLHNLEQEQLQLDSQEDANDSPGQENYDVQIQLGRKRKRP